MMTMSAPRAAPKNFINWPAYLTLAAVSIAGILSLNVFLARWGALLLLIAFGIFIDRYPSTRGPSLNRRANLYLAIQTALVIALLMLSYEGAQIFTILFFVLSSIAAQFNSFRLSLAWLSLFGLITAASFITRAGWGAGLEYTLPFLGGYLFFGVVANALNRASIAQNESAHLLADLRAAHEQLQAYASQVEALVIAEERNRLAREMHDTVGHRLTVAAVQLEGAQRLIPSHPQRAAAMVGTGREQVRAALQDLRHSVASLREPLETGLSLPTALQRLAGAFQEATGIHVHQDLAAVPSDLPAPQHQALYRAAQEGLTNIQRHAHASQAWIELSCQDGCIKLCLRDDGVGNEPEEDSTSQPEQHGFGLLGLKERAAQLNGGVSFTRLPGEGARLEMRLPLPTQPAEVAHE